MTYRQALTITRDFQARHAIRRPTENEMYSYGIASQVLAHWPVDYNMDTPLFDEVYGG